MNAVADLRLPAELAQFADRRRAWALLEPLLPRLLGFAGTIDALEISNTRFKSFLKPSSKHKFCFAAVYRIELRSEQGLPGGEAWIYLKAFVAGRSAAEYERHLSVGDPRPILLPELDALAWRFPHTPGLPQLADFFSADELNSMVADRDGREGEHHHATTSVEVVNFRPEQRCTLRVETLTAKGPVAWFVKTYADDTGRETFGRMSRLRRLAERHAIGLGIPRPVCYDERTRSLWLEEVRAEPLESRLIGERWQGHMWAVGRALARLHRHAEAGTTEWTPALLLGELAHKAARLVAVYPLLRQILPTLIEQLTNAAPCLAALPMVAIHGDFHIGQLLALDQDVVFCDLDELASGNPAQDLANFSVDLWLRGYARERVDAVERVILMAYCDEAGCDIDRAQFHWNAVIALANRAYRVYLQQPCDAAMRIALIVGEMERVRGLIDREAGSGGMAVAA